MKEEPDVNELKKKLRAQRKVEEQPTKHESMESEPATKADSDMAIPTETDIENCAIEHYREKEKPLGETIEKIETTKRNTQPKSNIKRKKFDINYLKWSLILLVAIIILSGLYYLIGDMSDVKKIELVGDTHLSREEILSRANIIEGDKMYLANVGNAEKNISMLPIVESINVSRDYPNKIVISLKEYDVVAYIESKGRYYPVLENEQVLRGFDMVPTDAPIIHFFDGIEFEELVKSLNQMNSRILSMISEIFYRPNEETNSRIQIYMNDGQEIIADLNTIGEKMNYYAGMKEEIGDKKGLIDLEVSNTFLPYNSDEVARIKQNIHNIPTQVSYLEDIEASLEQMKRSLEALKTEDK